MLLLIYPFLLVRIAFLKLSIAVKFFCLVAALGALRCDHRQLPRQRSGDLPQRYLQLHFPVDDHLYLASITADTWVGSYQRRRYFDQAVLVDG